MAKSWLFLATSAINAAAGGIIGKKAGGGDIPQELLIGAVVALALNSAATGAAGWFWSTGKCFSSKTIGVALTMLNALEVGIAGYLAETKCDGSFTCLEAAGAWAAALGEDALYAMVLACNQYNNNQYQNIN